MVFRDLRRKGNTQSAVIFYFTPLPASFASRPVIEKSGRLSHTVIHVPRARNKRRIYDENNEREICLHNARTWREVLSPCRRVLKLRQFPLVVNFSNCAVKPSSSLPHRRTRCCVASRLRRVFKHARRLGHKGFSALAISVHERGACTARAKRRQIVIKFYWLLSVFNTCRRCRHVG